MPIVEVKELQSSKSVPLQILNKGPEFFRQQAMRHQRRMGKTAAEQLAETRSQYLKRDQVHPPQQLNDNSNNHTGDNRLESSRGDVRQRRDRKGSGREESGVIKQEKIEQDKGENHHRGRDKNRDNRRSRRRGKGHTSDHNGNSEKVSGNEKASSDPPEHAKEVKDRRILIGGSSKEKTSGTPSDGGESPAYRRTSASLEKSRPSVKEMVSKISARSGSENCDDGNSDGTPRRIHEQSGLQKPKKKLNFVSSESSETSPVLPRRAEHFSRASRAPPMRGRERTRPSVPTKPSSAVISQKSPKGSRIQNVLNVLHQQTSTSSSSHDDTPRRYLGGARVRGKSCPPTSRSKPSLAALLARDAEGRRPRSKDMNDLEALTSSESDDSSLLAVKARIKSFQNSVSKACAQPETTPVSRTSDISQSSDEQVPSVGVNSRVSNEQVKDNLTSTTPLSHSSQKSADSSSVPLSTGSKVSLRQKQENMQNSSGVYYALPKKGFRKSQGPKKHCLAIDVSKDSDCRKSENKEHKTKEYVDNPRDIPNEKGEMQKSLKISASDEEHGNILEITTSVDHMLKSGKPVPPKKPDISVVVKPTRLSYHVYEEVHSPMQKLESDSCLPAKENVFENPAHFSDPEESFEIVPVLAQPVQEKGPSGPGNVAVILDENETAKEDPKTGSMFSTFSNRMKRLKGILMRDKDPQIMAKEHERTRVHQQSAIPVKPKASHTAVSSISSTKDDCKSPTQRKLAAQLGLECEEKVRELNRGMNEEKGEQSDSSSGRPPYEEQIHKHLPGKQGYDSSQDSPYLQERIHENGTAHLMLPVHSKSLSWDDMNRKKLKGALTHDTLPDATNCGKGNKVMADTCKEHETKTHASFHMPHEKQKQELSKKLELFLKQSKAYESGGDSPSKESCESGKLKKKVSFDDSSVPLEIPEKNEKTSLIRKVSITPLTENYDVVEYNSTLTKDLVEETIIIDSSNAIRLATPRSRLMLSTPDTKSAVKKKIPKIREDSLASIEDGGFESSSKGLADTLDDEVMDDLYNDTIVSNEDTVESSKQRKMSDKEPSSDDNKAASNGFNHRASKLVDFRKASVSTDFDTSPTHDYHRGATHDGQPELKHRSGTSSSGNARLRGEYDTSSRSDDCGLGATRARVKHLKPYNARPFRNKNFSSDEDVIPEEQSRKSFWLAKAQLDLPKPHQEDIGVHHIQASDYDSSGEGDNSAISRQSGMRRSKSEPSNATLAEELDMFFDRMGLDDSILTLVAKPHIYDEEEVFHEMHVWRTRGLRGSESDDSNTSYAMSEASNVSEEGVMNLRKFTKQLPDQSMSIVTKNARVIKWMCQCKKARTESLS